MQQQSLAVGIVNIPGDPTRNHSKGVTHLSLGSTSDGATAGVPFSSFPGWTHSKPCCVRPVIGITSSVLAPATSCTEGKKRRLDRGVHRPQGCAGCAQKWARVGFGLGL